MRRIVVVTGVVACAWLLFAGSGQPGPRETVGSEPSIVAVAPDSAPEHSQHIDAVDDNLGVVVPTHDPGNLMAGVVVTSNTTSDYPVDALVGIAVDLTYAELTGHARERYPWIAGNDTPLVSVTFQTATVEFSARAGDVTRISIRWAGVDRQGNPVTSSTSTNWYYRNQQWINEFE